MERKPKAQKEHIHLRLPYLSPRMSSDEEFTPLENGEALKVAPMETIDREIEKFKVTYERIMTDQDDLMKSRDEQRSLMEEFKKRSDKVKNSMEADELDRVKMVENGKAQLEAAQEEERKMKEQLANMEAEMRHLDQEMVTLQQLVQESNAMPEKKVVFLGATSEGGDSGAFRMKSRIVYPMEEGTALITFEDEAVAQNILRIKDHQIKQGDCFLNVVAKPVQLLMPSHVELATLVCRKRVLVSDLPKGSEESRLMDRLEIHFAKRKNLGGEVEGVNMLLDSGNAVVTFVDDSVSKVLTEKLYHEVNFGDKMKHQVKVTPYLNARVTDLQTCMSVSSRSVLLTEIPAVMDPSDLQDQLEIHFQKKGNGGGEVEAIHYNPQSKRALAVFQECGPEE
ncbi:hypothetical protein GJAV_G00225490 [Gymnothorax javanicus]|nr:hypothetical protein GJAV_G00225490 [Gymnothorax javanicus]